MAAAFLASANETEDGFVRNELAVRRAACFCANDVPWLGVSGFCDGAVILLNRDCSSLSRGLAGLDADADADVDADGSLCQGFEDSPMLRPGTDIPAEPSRDWEPWLR